MTVDDTELGEPEGHVPVGTGFAVVDDGASGAVHGFDGVHLVVDHGGVHVVLVVLPVAGGLPEVSVEDLGGQDLLVSGRNVDLPPVAHEGVLEDHSVGEEEGESGPLVGEHEDAEFAADLPVVPFLSFLEHVEVFFEVLFALEGGSVDPGEHLVVLVATPVGSGDGGELERLALFGVKDVGSGAEVGEFALFVEGDACILGEVLDELDLVVLVPFLHEFDCFVAGEGEGLEFEILFDDLLHLGLDLGEVLLGESAFAVHIVVKSFCDGGSDGQFGLGIEPFHGLGEDVGCRMPQYRETVFQILYSAVVK